MPLLWLVHSAGWRFVECTAPAKGLYPSTSSLTDFLANCERRRMSSNKLLLEFNETTLILVDLFFSNDMLNCYHRSSRDGVCNKIIARRVQCYMVTPLLAPAEISIYAFEQTGKVQAYIIETILQDLCFSLVSNNDNTGFGDWPHFLLFLLYFIQSRRHD